MPLKRALHGALCALLATTTLVAGAQTSNAAIEPEHPLRGTQRPNAALVEAARNSHLTQRDSVPLIAGTLRDSAGHALADTPLRIDLEPTRALISTTGVGIGLEYVKLAEARTAQDGTFAFTSGRFQDLTGYADQNGVASALITSAGGQHNVWRRI
ncbi:hypothetical protein HCN51_08040 [Nonomuraea sp. FMUSA5-5]|uniref:TonB-dependent receptor n=1 Tax=Nonomuraea composti TaxID=2720023 RepID=A0ABX1AZD3_9ACTN|nr:hypothetical protein [Nonomuraea sp. FMUSA5-5]NJP89399.1 hypothetical protein [Nonomuraea sp. FMUSA5-5]